MATVKFIRPRSLPHQGTRQRDDSQCRTTPHNKVCTLLNVRCPVSEQYLYTAVVHGPLCKAVNATAWIYNWCRRKIEANEPAVSRSAVGRVSERESDRRSSVCPRPSLGCGSMRLVAGFVRRASHKTQQVRSPRAAQDEDVVAPGGAGAAGESGQGVSHGAIPYAPSLLCSHHGSTNVMLLARFDQRTAPRRSSPSDENILPLPERRRVSLFQFKSVYCCSGHSSADVLSRSGDAQDSSSSCEWYPAQAIEMHTHVIGAQDLLRRSRRTKDRGGGKMCHGRVYEAAADHTSIGGGSCRLTGGRTISGSLVVARLNEQCCNPRHARCKNVEDKEVLGRVVPADSSSRKTHAEKDLSAGYSCADIRVRMVQHPDQHDPQKRGKEQMGRSSACQLATARIVSQAKTCSGGGAIAGGSGLSVQSRVPLAGCTVRRDRAGELAIHMALGDEWKVQHGFPMWQSHAVMYPSKMRPRLAVKLRIRRKRTEISASHGRRWPRGAWASDGMKPMRKATCID
nr:hypothetical protein CFP56_23958 [Quercus suber]